MKRYQITGAVVCGVAVCAFALIWFFSEPEAPVGLSPGPGLKTERAALDNTGAGKTTFEQESIFEETTPGDVELDEETSRQLVVARMKELFGKTISHARVQLQAIEKLIQYLKGVYPESWQEHVSEYLSAAFPEHAAILHDKYLKFTGFKQWISDNYALLVDMDPDDRKALLWEKRNRFFGNEAEIIWELERKAEQVAQSLEEINRQKETPFNEKVSSYLISLDDIYAQQAEAYTRLHQQRMMDRFLSLESVQADLRQMSAEERKAGLDLFRTAMGLDDAALNRWTELDEARDRRWANGQAYMQARQQVIERSGDLSRNLKMDELRQNYFGAEANTIKQEEEAGLFRFSQERLYGKN